MESWADGAASVIRTRDLTLTKGALYRWSYGSVTINAHGLHESCREVKFFPHRLNPMARSSGDWPAFAPSTVQAAAFPAGVGSARSGSGSAQFAVFGR